MDFLIISGLSGAGKTRAADVLEDLDFYCVDNMPTALLTKFAELCLATRGRYERVALVTDVRGQESFTELFAALDELRKMGVAYRILFVEASDATIIKRYKETRRPHPLAAEAGSIQGAVELEKRLLSPMRDAADYILNTTGLTLSMLQNRIRGFFEGQRRRDLLVSVESFGFKYGIPMDADMVLDVRFLPNPFYVEELRPQTGMDAPVRDYVLGSDTAQDFLDRLCGMIDFLLPQYAEEGRYGLTIAVGCTGGRHRSVAVAKALADHLSEMGEDVQFSNRDLEKS
ncbi:MAG: RNase adapter RapZ [Oscillospiraceae bacterium]|nr:RNase adapter RapZ [Oscillospiraceae bacterium]